MPIAAANGNTNLIVVALRANPGSSGNYYLVAQPGSGIETVADLRGKKVAYPPGTGRHMIVAAILGRRRAQPGGRRRPRSSWPAPRSPRRSPPAPSTPRSCSATSSTTSASHPDHRRRHGLQHRHQRPDRARRTPSTTRSRRPPSATTCGAPPPPTTRSIEDPTAWIEANYVEQQGLTFEQGKALVDDAGTGPLLPDRRGVDGAVPARRRRPARHRRHHHRRRHRARSSTPASTTSSRPRTRPTASPSAPLTAHPHRRRHPP